MSLWNVMDEYAVDDEGRVEFANPESFEELDYAVAAANRHRRERAGEPRYLQTVIRSDDVRAIDLGDYARLHDLQLVTAHHLREARRRLREASERPDGTPCSGCDGPESVGRLHDATEYAIARNEWLEQMLVNDWARYVRDSGVHRRTAEHLRKARGELRRLREENKRLCEELDEWRGDVMNVAGRLPPSHYAGDGLVTCSRAMESAASQGTYVAWRTPMQTWWWLAAFKYVWRMWSKQDPRADARKAIDCLEKSVIGVDVDG